MADKLLADFDAKRFGEIGQEADALMRDYSERDKMHEAMENIYLAEWLDGRPKRQDDEVKLTMAPDLTNKMIGAHRLLTSTEPQPSMPFDKNDPVAQEASNWMEKAARMMLQASGRIQGVPVHVDAVLSAIVFGEVHLLIENLAEQVEMMPKNAAKARRKRLERAAEKTPLLFRSVHPAMGYCAADRLGMYGYMRRYKTTIRELIEEWPGVDFGTDMRKEVVVRDWYDLEYRIAWIEGEPKPFFMRKHGLPAIPVVVQVAEGNNLLDKPEKRIRPFAYTAWKTQMDRRLHLALTALFTNIFAFASRPTFIHEVPAGTPDKALDEDGEVIRLIKGQEDFRPLLSKGAIDPALIQGIEIAQNKLTQSTIFDQALGEPLGANAPYSMVALLHQAGRLPLVSPQKMTGWALATALEKGFEWLRENGKSVEMKFQGESLEIDPQQIPETFSFDVRLEIDLPVDHLQQANTASVIKGQGLASKRWIRENLLSIGDSESMDEEIWSEDMADQLAMMLFQQMQAAEEQAAEEQAAEEQAAALAAQGAQGGQRGMPQAEGARGGITGEQQAMGAPMSAPLPPGEG